MKTIQLVLAIYGLGWILLILLIGLFGGRFIIEIKNPITKKNDTIANMSIKR